MPEHNNPSDYLALEMMSELKTTNKRQTTVIKCLLGIICGSFIAVLLVVAGFLIYLNQYDFSSSESITNTASGVYTLVDSSGNVVASDMPAEEIVEMIINGQSELDQNYYAEKD